jgi:hypothetical protein
VVVFEPSATPSATPSSSPTVEPTTTVTATGTPEPTNTPTATTTATKKPRDDDEPLPTLPPPVTSTIDPAQEISPLPAGLNTGAPDGSNASGANFPDGHYFVMNFSANPVIVEPTPDGHYDMVFYEDENPNGDNKIDMDQVIIGISKDPSGNPYYEVFNWGNGVPDANSNVDTTTLGLPVEEVDNQNIPTTDLYKDPASPAPPPNLQTGILIDVDNASSHPPPDTYNYVVVIAPPATNPGNVGDDGQVDSVQVTEVASPAPP